MRRDAPWMRVPADLRPIWFHCASGEFEYAKPVIRAIKLAWPDQTVLVTYFSPSAETSVPAFAGVDFACPSPWDTPRDLGAFIARAKPRALLIARTDVWPEMAEQATAAGVPSLLFSATLTAASGRSSRWARPIACLAFGPLDRIFCVGEADRTAFAALGFAAKTSVEGDTRFEQALARLASPKPINRHLFESDPSALRVPTLIAGSTWAEDEGPLLEALQSLEGRVRLCLVPHEPTPARLLEIEARARAMGVGCVRYGAASSWPAGAILLVDRVGVLAELYACGDLAFVGGSFRSSVHSVMEPLACGLRTLVGPRHRNNREAEDFRTVIAGGRPAVIACENGAQLAKAIDESIAGRADESVAAAIHREVRMRTGRPTASVMAWVAGVTGRSL